MPIPQLELDDRTYNDFVEEALTLIPGYFPDWTDHNPTDPGIILVEMLAWLVEMTLYRVNRVSEKNLKAFLGLLDSSTDFESLTGNQLQVAVHETIAELRTRYRAVTPGDFEFLATRIWPNPEQGSSFSVLVNGLVNAGEPRETAVNMNLVRRAHIVANNKAESQSQLVPAEGHVTLVVVPGHPETLPAPTSDLCNALKSFYENRRMLTTRVHVVGPEYVRLGISASGLYLNDGADQLVAEDTASGRLTDFFNPLSGGPDNKGWPFGRDVYASEIYEILDGVEGIDHVETVTITNAQDNVLAIGDNQLVGQVTVSMHNWVSVW